MKNITITTTDDYLSIKKEFTWTDIPMFAIITGVNGAGKTHLIQILESGTEDPKKNLGTRSKMQPKIYNATNSKGDNIELIMAHTKAKFDIDALINYNSKRSEIYKQVQEQFKLATEDNDVADLVIPISQFPETYRKLERALKIISEDADILIEDLTEANIRDQFSLSFNHLSKIDNLNSYIAQEEKNRNEKYIKLAKEGREGEIKSIRDVEKAYEKINRLFERFGFNTYLVQDPYPANKSRLGAVEFIGKNGERVKYDALSSGEQMIVEFIIWEMGKDVRGNSINIMLLDEYDAHLHPSMCKMMIEILSDIAKPKEEGGSGIRVIMTTHSPSTVAFAPEGSLFVMEKDDDGNRNIRSTSNSEAMSVLSDGIFTLEKAASVINLAVSTEKKNIIFVEGKTDPLHLEKAIKMLGYEEDLDAQIIGMYGVDTLYSFVNTLPSVLVPNKRVIALFDGDGDGIARYNKLKSPTKHNVIFEPVLRVVSEQSLEKFYATYLISPDTQTNNNCPIEYLYPLDFLKKHSIIKKIDYPEFEKLEKAGSSYERMKINEELDQGKTYRVFKLVKDEKVKFSKEIANVNNPRLFEGFRPTLELLKTIVNLKQNE